MTTTSRSAKSKVCDDCMEPWWSSAARTVHTVRRPLLPLLQMKGVNVEAVLRVEEDEENGGKRTNKSRQKEVEDDLGLSMLIDSQNNQYVLTKPRDSTMPRADHHFIKVARPFGPAPGHCVVRYGASNSPSCVSGQDLVSVVMLSLPCGWMCTLVGLPPMFGYIICGVLLGPSGLNSIKVCVCVSDQTFII